VTRSFSPDPAVSKSPSSGAAASTCSKLSRMTSASRVGSSLVRVSEIARSGRSGMPTAEAMAEAARPGSLMLARGTKYVPSANSEARRRPMSIPRRLLPTPPGPVRVSKRIAGSRSRTSAAAISRLRPIRVVSGLGSRAAVDSKASDDFKCRSYRVVRRAGWADGRFGPGSSHFRVPPAPPMSIGGFAQTALSTSALSPPMARSVNHIWSFMVTQSPG
jgi:hypothetical protein